ncbi:MAG: TonB-dependent receptor [Acidobacteria bacterium]|nr:TonB-dependent receptor [Acidobacteriota bacterium]
MLRRVVVSLAFVLLASGLSFAQQNAQMGGTITDESKAVLPGVTVSATDLDSGHQFTAVTNERGEYRLLNVPPGRYAIQAELSGFGTLKISQLELLVGQNATVPFTMKVATIQESVTVTGESPLVDTQSSEISGNVDRRQMEQLPLAGRNWMELSLMVKGITSNNVDQRPGVENDDAFQLNLDGQQITNKVASSGFGQPRFSREAIAEFQIVTNLFDITQGRSIGVQVQAISRSGTNTPSGAFYGYFRDDKFSSADFVARRVLPFSNQQVGGAMGGPLVRDKLHYFTSYEYEREPNTAFFKPVNLPSQSFSFPDKTTQHSFLARVDQQTSPNSHLSYRYSIWNYDRPFEKQGEHPTQAAARTRHAANTLVSWSKVLSDRLVQEVKGGYSTFNWTNGLGVPELSRTPSFTFLGGIIGPPQNFPQEFHQHVVSARYDLTWTLARHEVKIGGEFLGWKDTGEWHLGERGVYNFGANPPDLERRFPANAYNNPAAWDLTGLDQFATNFLQNVGDWNIDIPRPTYALWFGDTWRIKDRLTVNYGVRYDLDWGATAPPDVRNTTEFAPFGRPLFKPDIHDNNNVAPRVGFAWDVSGKQDLVIRGGSGRYYGDVISNVTFSQQSFGNRIIVNSFNNDRQPGWFLNPTRGFTAEQVRSGAVPQAPRVIAHDFELPFTWQTAVGFQKQLTSSMGFEADLTHWRLYNGERGRDINLFFDPATGYNVNPAVGRPDPRWAGVLWIESKAKADYLGLSSAFHRRFSKNVQAGLTHTVMFFKRDNHPPGGFGPNANNPFDLDDAEWARSTDFQRNTVRFNGMIDLGRGLTVAGVYLYGSGTLYTTSIAGNPFGKNSLALGLTNRLYLGPARPVPESALDRYDGPATLNNGDVVPRNALRGLPIHKVDFRISKVVKLAKVQLMGVAEVFNAFNHANYGLYNAVVNSAAFGQPLQNLGNTYRPRTGQLAFRISF